MSFSAAPRLRFSSGGEHAAVRQGTRVGRFRVIRLLGRGGMASVYLAEDVTLHRYVALKLLSDRAGSTARHVEQFLREARAAAALEHPGVVQVYEVGLEAGFYFIAMEHVEGGTLHELVRLGKPITVRQACLLAAEAADALSLAHGHGILHRDIKPANLMLTRAGRCKVTDFGLARLDDPSDNFSLPHDAVGSPHFVAPELLAGEPATRYSDIYSLGCTLWYLLTGVPPYRAATRRELLMMHVKAAIPRLADVRTDVPPELSDAIAKAMAKEPGQRHASMSGLAKLLRSHTIATDADLSPAEAAFADSDVINDLVGLWPVQSRPTAQAKRLTRSQLIGGSVAAASLLAAVCIWFGQSQSPTVRERTVVAAHPAPPRAPAPVPQTPAPPPPVVEPALTLTDGPAIARLASDGKPCVFRGTITRCGPSNSGAVYQIFFNPPGQDDVIYAVYFPDLFTTMAQAHGPLAGKTVEIRGTLKPYRGIPQIVISDPDQLTVLH